MNILVIAELVDGKVRKSTHSAINFARQAGAPFSILVLGASAKGAIESARRFKRRYPYERGRLSGSVGLIEDSAYGRPCAQ
jgi:electron transfer flavoprotein alpha subunit